MRALASICVILAGCGKPTLGDDGTGDDDNPKGWTITVDMSGLDRFVQPATSTTWHVAGTATASDGLAGVTVAGSPVAVDGSGAFATDVGVMPGLTRVPILASDATGHTRKGDRTLLAARLLPDNAPNAQAASMVLSDATLAAMSGGLAGQAGDVDVAGEIMMKPVLSQDDRCTTWPVMAHQGTVAVALAQKSGDLYLTVTVPDLYVYFEGECQGLLSTIPLAGEMTATLVIQTKLSPKPGADGSCLTAFGHTTPAVAVQGWGFDVWGTGGPLQNWIIELFSGQKSDQARSELATEVGAKANDMLTTKLANVTVFDRTSNLDFLGKSVAMHLCLTRLDKVGTQLVARVAAATTGAGTRAAPGAPQIDGAVPAAPAGELLLDANLVAQLMFAAWRDDGLQRPGPDVDAGLLEALVPALATRYPDATTAQVAVDAELPAVVRAIPGTNGDLAIELGDLMVTLSIDGDQVFKLGVHLTLTVELVPTMGKLAPKVVDTKADVALLDELVDAPDDALEQAVALKIGDAAAQLLGDGAALSLPDLPGLGAPVDVTPDAGGRFLHVKLAN
jgi:hypothetical protein